MLALEWTEPASEMRVGKYLLLDAIGSGAFSVVWHCQDVRAHTPAAVKIFRPLEFPEADREEAAVRFYEGAAAMRKLAQSVHVVQLYDGPHFTDGYLWFSMEYMPDGDLSKSLKHGSLDLKDKLQIIDDLINALDDAHREKICHRDLRPPNILIKRTKSGLRAILADFDIAYYDHILRPRQSTVTPRSVGRYTPPEVFTASSAHMKKFNGPLVPHELGSFCAVRALHGVPSLET